MTYSRCGRGRSSVISVSRYCSLYVMKLIALSLFLLIAFTNAQFQERCETPAMWTGSFREIDYVTKTLRFGNISYDANLEAISVIEIERVAGDTQRRVTYREVFLFQEKMSYKLDYNTNSCEGKQLTSPFTPWGAPYGSSFEGTNYIGGLTQPYGVRVEEYFMRREGDYAGSFAPLANPRECIPVLESFIRSSSGPGPSESTNTHIEYLNIDTVTSFPAGTFSRPPQCD